MTIPPLETDEHVEAASALEMIAEQLPMVRVDSYRWKWVIIGLHNALQAFMVLALQGSDGLTVMPDRRAQKWLDAYRSGKTLPPEKLDGFLNLYRKLQAGRMPLMVDGRPFTPTKEQNCSVGKLNKFRNAFVHFGPKKWVILPAGLPDITLHCLALTQFLGWESHVVHWPSPVLERRARFALERCRLESQHLQESYSGGT